MIVIMRQPALAAQRLCRPVLRRVRRLKFCRAGELTFSTSSPREEEAGAAAAGIARASLGILLREWAVCSRSG